MFALFVLAISIVGISGIQHGPGSNFPPFPSPDVVNRCGSRPLVRHPTTGLPIVCSPFTAPDTNECPFGGVCAGGPADEPGYCCQVSNPFPTPGVVNRCGQRPLARNPLTGQPIVCSPFVPVGTSTCPSGSVCAGGPADEPGFCCINAGPDPCPGGNPPAMCFADPCQVTRCPAFPEALCRANYCEGCIARFYLNGREVTDFCRRSRYG